MNDEQGVSLVEVSFWIIVFSFAGLAISRWMKGPTQILVLQSRTDVEQQAFRALDTVVSDLREADVSTINFSEIEPIGTSTTGLSWFRKTHLNSQPPFTYVEYTFQATGPTTGSLIRYENTSTQIQGASQTVIMANLDLPTTTDPILQQDTNKSSVLIATLLCRPSTVAHTAGANTAASRVIRRVVVRG